MNNLKRITGLQILVLSLVLVAVLLLASGLPSLRFQPGEPIHLYAWLKASVDSNQDLEMDAEISNDSLQPNFWSRLGERTLVTIFWVVLVFSILYAIVSPRFRRQLIQMALFILPIALFLPQIMEQMNLEALLEPPEALPGYTNQPETTIPEPPPFIQQPPGWFLDLVNALLLALLLVGIILIWRRSRRKPDPKTVVVENIQQALSEMETGSDFKDVIISCYARMCRGLQDSRGLQLHQDMTPREFEITLSQAGVTSDHIRELTRLFEGVRYGSQPASLDAEARAIQSLQSILKTYGE